MKIKNAVELVQFFPDLGFEVISSTVKRHKSKMEITGKIIVVGQPRGGVSTRSGNSWKMQDFVIETIEQYPRKCMFNVFGEDRLKEFNIQIGETMTVSFDIDAREYNGRWYNDIRAWKVSRPNVNPSSASSQPSFGPEDNVPPF